MEKSWSRFRKRNKKKLIGCSHNCVKLLKVPQMYPIGVVKANAESCSLDEAVECAAGMKLEPTRLLCLGVGVTFLFYCDPFI